MRGYEVDVGELQRHARHVDNLADNVASTGMAAGRALGGEAYGVLCSFLPPLINDSAQEAVEAIEALGAMTHETAEGVNWMVRNYMVAEDEAVEAYYRARTPFQTEVG